MTQQSVISQGAAKDISKLAAGSAREDVALDALKEVLTEERLSPSKVQAIQTRLETLLGCYAEAPGLTAASASYNDTREGFGPHNAIKFAVEQSTKVKLGELLKSLLGKEDAAILMSDWGDRINFNDDAPSKSEVVLFLDSNNKARNRSNAEEGARTTQEEDFKGAGLAFADDRQAIIVCATAVKRARIAGLDLSKSTSTWAAEQSRALGRLTESEINLLSTLGDGVVRSCSGGLGVHADGRLHASDFSDFSSAGDWAFGGPSRPE